MTTFGKVNKITGMIGTVALLVFLLAMKHEIGFYPVEMKYPAITFSDKAAARKPQPPKASTEANVPSTYR